MTTAHDNFSVSDRKSVCPYYHLRNKDPALNTSIPLIPIVCLANAQYQRTIYFVRVRGETRAR